MADEPKPVATLEIGEDTFHCAHQWSERLLDDPDIGVADCLACGSVRVTNHSDKIVRIKDLSFLGATVTFEPDEALSSIEEK